MTVLTPTVRQGARRARFWIGGAAFLVAVAIGAVLLLGTTPAGDPLSPTNAAPSGTLALVEVLRQRGVAVTVTDNFAATAAAITNPAATTLVVHDPNGMLDDQRQHELLALGAPLVLLDPGFLPLQTLAPGVSQAGMPDATPLSAGCDFPAATRAGEVSSGGSSYRVVDSAGPAITCLESAGDGSAPAFSFVRLAVEGTTVSVLGATQALTNGEIGSLGNAAFALNLLGANPALVWYVPSAADLPGAGDAAALTPGWVTPLIALLALTAIAAAVWRGRRFGPLIVENLPVVVRASETMEGRARLYQAGSARLRAIDALRIGAVTRLASLCGLSSSATIDEVVLVVADLSGTDPRSIRELLVDAEPHTDAELVGLSDGLRELEAAVAAAVRP